MAARGAGRELTDLERGAILALGNGSETTLLVLQILNDPRSRTVTEKGLDQGRLAEALSALELDGLVVRRTEHREPVREPGFNIPEWDEGRAEVVWWELTPAGKRRLEDEHQAP